MARSESPGPIRGAAGRGDGRTAAHLEREGARPFTATVRGTRREATTRALLRPGLRHPWSTAAVSAGIRLYLRGVPVQPRPRPRTPENVT